MLDHTNYDNGFNFYFDYPLEIVPGVRVSIELRGFIEPDESVGCSDWYVANVYLAQNDQEITKDNPIALAMSSYCSRTYEAAIGLRWQEWLENQPRRRSA